jgi:hypothetical protein
MVKLVDTQALGACGATHESSSLSIPTKLVIVIASASRSNPAE